MDYCVKYNPNLKCLSKVEEILLPYKKRDVSLLEFLLAHQNQRVILQIDGSQNKEDFYIMLNILKEIKEKYSNLKLAIKIENFNENIEIQKIKEINIPYFLDIYARNWEIFNDLINKGVSDIYIVEELGFDLKAVSALAKKYNIKIRVFPNIAQSYCQSTKALKKFFIRPEDIDLYSNFIDVCEFISQNNQEDILYKIYRDEKKWFGPLDEIIIDLNSGIDNRYLIPSFSEKRIYCNRECLKGDPCEKCEIIARLSETLKKAGLAILTKPQNK